MLQALFYFTVNSTWKCSLEYLLDSSVIILLHDLQRVKQKNLLVVVQKEWLVNHDCNMDWLVLTGPYATSEKSLSLPHFSMSWHKQRCLNYVRSLLCVTTRLVILTLCKIQLSRVQIQHFLISCSIAKHSTEGARTATGLHGMPTHSKRGPIFSSNPQHLHKELVREPLQRHQATGEQPTLNKCKTHHNLNMFA